MGIIGWFGTGEGVRKSTPEFASPEWRRSGMTQERTSGSGVPGSSLSAAAQAEWIK